MRVVVFDKNPGPGFDQWLLKTCWLLACWFQKLVGWTDDYYGAESWLDAEQWLIHREETLTSVQYWGHGSAGVVWLGQKPMPVWTLTNIRKRLCGPSAVVWFRCCSVFQGAKGQLFAKRALGELDCRVVAHTYSIGLWQPGGHSVRPSQPEPSWPVGEGAELEGALWPDYLRPWLPNTVFCFKTLVPPEW